MNTFYKNSEDSYVYGPICVSQNQRGKGLAQLMFQKLISLESNREGILFIKSNNEDSLKAHSKMVIRFHFNNSDFDVFAYLFPLVEDNKKS